MLEQQRRTAYESREQLDADVDLLVRDLVRAEVERGGESALRDAVLGELAAAGVGRAEGTAALRRWALLAW